jgi:hypothetical protein
MTESETPSAAVRAASTVIDEWFSGMQFAQFMPAVVVEKIVAAVLSELPDRESYEETIAVLSDPEAMEGIREGEQGDSDEFRSRPAEPRHYIALVGGARAYTKLTPHGPDAFPAHGPGDPIEIAGDNKWYPVSEEIALAWTRDDDLEEDWEDDV